MFPPSRQQPSATSIILNQLQSTLPPNPPNPRHRNPADLRGNFLRRRKQQLVILATVQREIKPDLPRRTSYPRPRNRRYLNLRPHAALLANMFEISRQPVTEINHRRSHPPQPF